MYFKSRVCAWCTMLSEHINRGKEYDNMLKEEYVMQN